MVKDELPEMAGFISEMTKEFGKLSGLRVINGNRVLVNTIN